MTKKSRTRSPQYPYFGLRTAVEKTRDVYEYAKRNAVSVDGVFKHWGYSGDTGSARKALAALKYFGLIEQPHGSKELKLSERALRILLDHEGSEARIKALQAAFLAPKLYSYMWNKWGLEMPHDNEIKSHLIFDKGFNESTVGGFVNDYKQSLEYANIAKGDLTDNEENDEEGEDFEELPEESETSKKTEVKRKSMKPGMQQATFPLDEGEVFFQWPEKLSQTSLEDLEAWLELVKRKIQRSVQDPEQGVD